MLSKNMIEILQLLNEFGFCDIRHIMNRFQVKKTIAYGYMQNLLKRGLINNTRVIAYHPRAYYLTSKGIDLLKLDLPLVRKIPLHVYEHHLSVIDVYLKLIKQHPECYWLSERRIFREKFSTQSKQNEHLPDGVLIFPQGEKYAIEIEKSLKARKRLDDILINYGLQREYKEVWYFAAKGVLTTLTELASNMPYVKIYSIAEFLL